MLAPVPITPYDRMLERTAIRNASEQTARNTSLIAAKAKAMRDGLVELSSHTQAVEGALAVQTDAQREGVQLLVSELDTLGQGINEGIVAVGDRLEGSLSDGFGRLDITLRDGLSRLETELKDLNVKSGWTDAYKRFVRRKQAAFELAARGDAERAAEQARSGLAVREPDGGVEDAIIRDPATNVLLARLIVTGRVKPTSADEAFACARAAYERGEPSTDKVEHQAAADAAHILAVCAREKGLGEAAINFEAEAYRLETRDDVAALAALLAGHAVFGTSAERVGRAVAHASVVHPRFAPLFLSQPAALASPAAFAGVVTQASEVLRELCVQSLATRERQESSWRSLAVPLAPRLPEGAAGLTKGDARGAQGLVGLATRVRGLLLGFLSTDEAWHNRIAALLSDRFDAVKRLEKERVGILDDLKTMRYGAEERVKQQLTGKWDWDRAKFVGAIQFWVAPISLGLFLWLAVGQTCADAAGAGCLGGIGSLLLLPILWGWQRRSWRRRGQVTEGAISDGASPFETEGSELREIVNKVAAKSGEFKEATRLEYVKSRGLTGVLPIVNADETTFALDDPLTLGDTLEATKRFWTAVADDGWIRRLEPAVRDLAGLCEVIERAEARHQSFNPPTLAV